MENIETAELRNLKHEIEDSIKRLKIVEQLRLLKDLEAQSQKQNFWDDNDNAQKVMKKIADLQAITSPWVSIKSTVEELLDLYNLNDPSLDSELKKNYSELKESLNSLKKQLSFQGKYDARDVILTIYAGAGGTDAQDWVQMLSRMYQRWAEKNNLKTKTLQQSLGEEAGIKSVSMSISGGQFLYGKLKSEQGVHRLVRLSPYNADNLRQTSFAKVDILPVIDSPKEIALDDKDVKIDVFRAGGHGGQSVNTTDSAVRVTHLPTGIIVTIQNERSQLQNKETAMTILKSRLLQIQVDHYQDKINQLKGDKQSAEWGNQTRNYILHPYNLVKDLKSGYETNNTQATLNGEIDPFIEAAIESSTSQ